MAKIVKPLSATEVKQAKGKDKAYKLFDGDGLVLKVRPNGSKSWLFIYKRPFVGTRTELVLGKFPNLSLSDARKKKTSAHELLAHDIDPKEQKEKIIREQQEVLSNTFESVAADWFSVKRTSVTEDHAKDLWRSLELHIFPELGRIPVSKVSAPMAINILRPIEAKGSLETVKRLSQRLNEVMNYAVNVGLIHASPLTGIKAAFTKPDKKHLPTLKPEQLPELMKTISFASIKTTTRCLIEWQLHTMVRPSEAAGTRWCEIDLENKLWVIPPERMKKKVEHIVPLSPQCLDLLERMQVISGSREHVFPADRKPTDHTNEQTANMALKRMGFHNKLVAHGMRALASTTLNEQGFDSDVIESALAHVDKNSVRKAYNRAQYLERRRLMMVWWSETIELARIGKINKSTNGLFAVN